VGLGLVEVLGGAVACPRSLAPCGQRLVVLVVDSSDGEAAGAAAEPEVEVLGLDVGVECLRVKSKHVLVYLSSATSMQRSVILYIESTRAQTYDLRDTQIALRRQDTYIGP
jgi:hypothetical protein